MNTGPFPVDKRIAAALAMADDGPDAAADSPSNSGSTTLSAIARGGVVKARRVPYRRTAIASQQPQNAEDDEGLNAPERNYDCTNYETCLGLAAALDWKSFTCCGCCGTVNQQLLWRAHHRIRNNPSLSKLCNLPILSGS